ncbi:MAG: leucyl/phenylalanyl-tRNA--protein transferase [Methyloceanibacter sp.]
MFVQLSRLPNNFGVLARYRGALPDPERASRDPDGLAGNCADLSVPILCAAYAKGLYPGERGGRARWWAPSARMVSFPETIYISERTRIELRAKTFEVTFDRDFEAIVHGCDAFPGPRPGRTGIPSRLVDGHVALHEAGRAHSVEVWDATGRLAGGLFGVGVGKAFFIEAMHSRARGAAKAAFVTLSCHLEHWGFALIGGKRMSGELSQLGFMLVPRSVFNGLLEDACREPGREGNWAIDRALDVSRWRPRLEAVTAKQVRGRSPELFTVL